jgi:hypothetical protein
MEVRHALELTKKGRSEDLPFLVNDKPILVSNPTKKGLKFN